MEPARPAAAPVVIAHRGASGYLPEHTLPAKALAHAQGADFLEQDVVIGADGVPVVLHDIHLDDTTDVAVRFPGRAREDGRHYCTTSRSTSCDRWRSRSASATPTAGRSSPAAIPPAGDASGSRPSRRNSSSSPDSTAPPGGPSGSIRRSSSRPGTAAPGTIRPPR